MFFDGFNQFSQYKYVDVLIFGFQVILTGLSPDILEYASCLAKAFDECGLSSAQQLSGWKVVVSSFFREVDA